MNKIVSKVSKILQIKIKALLNNYSSLKKKCKNFDCQIFITN